MDWYETLENTLAPIMEAKKPALKGEAKPAPKKKAKPTEKTIMSQKQLKLFRMVAGATKDTWPKIKSRLPKDSNLTPQIAKRVLGNYQQTGPAPASLPVQSGTRWAVYKRNRRAMTSAMEGLVKVYTPVDSGFASLLDKALGD